LTNNVKACSIIFRKEGIKYPRSLLENMADDPEEEDVTRSQDVEMLASKPKV
jgi:hypothetical protein